MKINEKQHNRSVVGRGRGGRCPLPLFSLGGTRPPLPHFFGLKFVQKLVHSCNWLLTETQCKIISVQQVCRPKLLKKSLSKSCFRRPPTSLLGLHPCSTISINVKQDSKAQWCANNCPSRTMIKQLYRELLV